MISITRFRDIDRWRLTGPWVLVYGRRKTGKTYFVKNHAKYDKYFFVSRSRDIFIDRNRIAFDTFLREVINDLEEGKSIVVDEFQRLPDEFMDRLHSIGIKGRLILISSTLKLMEKYIGSKSPLLGLVSGFRLGLIDERDIIVNMHNYIKDPRRLVEYSIYLREPWLIPLWEATQEKFHEAMLENLNISVPALIGEIFREEERQLSMVYEAILRNIADGRRVSGELARQLYSQKLIPAQNPSLIHPYLKILVDMGILEKIKIYNKKMYHYYHASPVTDLYYYLDAKYGYAERMIPKEQLNKIMNEKLPHHIEQFMGNLLAKTLGLHREKIIEKGWEIDIALNDFHKLRMIAEVRWRKKISRTEIKEIEDKLNKYNCRKILIVPNKEIIKKQPRNIEVWDINTILEILKKQNNI